MSIKQLVYKFTLWLQEKFDITWCVIYSRMFDYTKWKGWSNNWFKNDCPFCNINKQDIVSEYKNFILMKNKYPYFNTEDHLLIVPKRHIRSWEELTDEEIIEFKNIISRYLDKGYLLLWRQFVKKWFRNHASVWHLHVHLVLNKEKWK